MEDTWDYDGLNIVNLIIVSCFLGIQFIWMIFVTVCFCKMRDSMCNRIHNVVYSGWVFAMAIVAVVMTSVQFAGMHDRAGSLRKWSHYADCVDPYMQINDY